MAEDVGEAGAVEEEEGARDDNFSPHNCYQIVGNFGFFFVQVLFMVSVFNKLKSEKVVCPVLSLGREARTGRGCCTLSVSCWRWL